MRARKKDELWEVTLDSGLQFMAEEICVDGRTGETSFVLAADELPTPALMNECEQVDGGPHGYRIRIRGLCAEGLRVPTLNLEATYDGGGKNDA